MKKNKNNLADLFDNKVDNIEKEINELFSELMDHLPINNERLVLLEMAKTTEFNELILSRNPKKIK